MKLKVIISPEAPASAKLRRPLLLSVFTVVLSLLTAVAALCFVAINGLEFHGNEWALATLLLLTVLGTHGEEVFGDETAMNGSILVILAGAGVAFAGGPLWIAGACGLVAGLHWHHVRDRAVRKLLVNTSFTTLSALAATEVARVLATEKPGLVALAICGVVTVMAYWLTDNFLVAVVLMIVDGRPLREHARELVRSETDVIPFALLGFFCGYLAVVEGPWSGVLGTAALLVLTEGVVFRRGRRGSVRRVAQWVPRVAPIGAGCLVLASIDLGAIRHASVLVFLAVTSSVGVGILDRFRASWGLFALVVCAVGASVALPGDSPASVVLVVGIGACLGFVVRDRQIRNRLAILSAAVAVTLAVGGLISGVGPGVSSVEGSLLLGLLAGLAALLAWHSVIGLALVLDLGRSMLPPIGTVIAGDAMLILAGGLCGIGVGWIGIHLGVLGLLASVFVLLSVGRLLLALSTRRAAGHDEADLAEADLADSELLDVLRSALLDVPASRLPD
jgi:hypothetical protein